MKEVEVIAEFLTDGTIKPFKIRLSENDDLIVIPIKRLLFTENLRNTNYVRFGVETVINDTLKRCELFYYPVDYRWYLKM